LTHPTTGNVLVGLANQADFTFAEPGAHVELDANRTPRGDGAVTSAEALMERGVIDGVVSRHQQRNLIERLLRLLGARGTVAGGRELLPAASALRASDELSLCRRPQRPGAHDYLERATTESIELHGDRKGADSPGIVGSIGRIGGATVVTFGVTRHAAGLSDQAFAKVNRLLRLAAHLELPVVSFIETAGHVLPAHADTGLGMSLTLSLLAAMPAPVVSVVIGEVAGLGGVTLLTADRVVMQEHAVISSSPGEPVASARDCHRLGLVDAIVPEPDPAADVDPDNAAAAIQTAVANMLSEVLPIRSSRVAEDRARQLRQLGLSTEEGREVARAEWVELQEIQRRIGRSLDDLRQRWEHRQLSIPALTNRPGPSPRAFLSSRSTITMPKFTIKRPDLSEIANRMQSTRVGMALREPPDLSRAEGESDDAE
jgi:acetyl-CoA carboxylase carboxyl transferase subunit beta